MMSKQIDCSGLTSFLQNTPAANSDIKKSTGLNKVLVSPDAFKAVVPTAQPEVCDGIVAFLDVLGTSSLMESVEKDGIKQEDIQQIYATTIGMQAEFKNSLQVILENFGVYHKLKAYFLVKNTLIFKKKGAPLRFFARCAFITALIIIQIP